METEDTILYNPDSGELFMSNKEKIRQVTTELNQILKNKTLSDEEIINYLRGDL